MEVEGDGKAQAVAASIGNLLHLHQDWLPFQEGNKALRRSYIGLRRSSLGLVTEGA